MKEFEDLLNKYDTLGYRVNQINEKAAVIYNNGVDEDYSQFDNTVATLAVRYGFNFLMPENAKELYEATVKNKEESKDHEIYMGVCEENAISVLRENCDKSFSR